MLRDVLEGDLQAVLEHQQDAETNALAAYPAKEQDAFTSHWRNDPDSMARPDQRQVPHRGGPLVLSSSLSRPASPGPLARWFQRRFGTTLTLALPPGGGLRLSDATRVVDLPVALPAGAAAAAPPAVRAPAGAPGEAPFVVLVHALRTGLQHFVARRLPVRPAVVIQADAALRAGLGGYLPFLLEQAAYDAGARTVTFEPPLPTPTGASSRWARAT